MRRAHEYVVVYEDHELSSVIASEHYYQQRFDGSGQPPIDRVLRSDYLIFQLPPQEDWFALRVSVSMLFDGAVVTETDGRVA
jgi:hypothetical protein